MRQDTAALVITVERAAADPDARRVLAGWFEAFAAGIVHHHQVEDDLFWPVLSERSEEFALAAADLDDDHHQLDAAMVRVAASLSGPGGDAVGTVRAFVEVLEGHLDREEAVAIPAMLACLSAEEFDTAVHGGDEERDGLPRAGLGPSVAARPRHRGGGRRRPRDPAAPVRWMNAVRWTRRYERLGRPGPSGAGMRHRRRASLPPIGPDPLPLRPARAPRGPGRRPVRGLRRRRRRGQRHDHRRGRVADRAAHVPDPFTSPRPTSASSHRRSGSRPAESRLTLDNQGKEDHQVQLGLVEPGTTADSFARTFHEKGAGEAHEMLRWQTG